jgi:hypothetical protein
VARSLTLFLVAAIGSISWSTAFAQSNGTQNNGAPSFTFTGYAQPQFDHSAVEDATRDRVFFRRLVVGFQTEMSENWAGALQVDTGPTITGDRLHLRDAYLRYRGLAVHGITLTAGNQKVPFSRSVLESSQRRSLIERPFTGERAFGAPGRAFAVQADGRHSNQRVQWAASVASVFHAPDAAEIRFDGMTEAEGTWNHGVMTTGRAEWHPKGAVSRDQGDFTRGAFRVMAGIAAYAWKNTGGRNRHTIAGISTSPLLADLDNARAIELDSGLRGHGLSIDLAWSRISARTIDRGFTRGIYSGGLTALQQLGSEAGVMVVPRKLELLAGADTMSIAARDARAYRLSVGTNWYMNGHRLKVGVMHRQSVNVLGVRDARAHATHVQAQVAF